MSSKKWLVAFVCTVLAFGLLTLAFNVLVDPFGVFGDVIFHWDSYSQTLNPRVGKIEYLDRHCDEYDSYIIGCSSTSSFPVEELDEYMDARFYNLFTYGADMLDSEDFVRYIIKNYTVKNILLNVYIDNGHTYDDPGIDNLTGAMHARVDESSLAAFYWKYLFLDPNYAIDKVRSFFKDELLAEPYDVFDVKTGCYDKRERDAEPISGLEEYEAIEQYSGFADYPTYHVPLKKTAQAMESLVRIKEMCDEAGVNLIVVCGPVYSGYMQGVDRQEAEEFYTSLAEVTDYWDFSISSVSTEPRYFYDLTHFRNCVGSMALARMFGNGDVYVPEDFGVYVTRENAVELVERNDAVFASRPRTDEWTKDVPILVYHNIVPDGEEGATVSMLEGQLAALRKAGYESVTFRDLEDYVYRGTELPEKCVVITFDDGYYSNYEYAYPLLEKYGMRATIFVIGVSVGHKEFYKDTEFVMTPHFDEEEMAEMSSSGVISIQSHTYDMHQWPPFETGGHVRETLLRFEDEDEEEYVRALQKDFERSRSQIEAVTGERVDVLAYPGGGYDILSQWALTQCGVNVTLSTRYGVNTLVKGLPQCLGAMHRIYGDAFPDAGELIAAMKGKR